MTQNIKIHIIIKKQNTNSVKKRVALIDFIESLGWWKLDIEIYVKRALENTAGN